MPLHRHTERVAGLSVTILPIAIQIEKQQQINQSGNIFVSRRTVFSIKTILIITCLSFMNYPKNRLVSLNSDKTSIAGPFSNGWVCPVILYSRRIFFIYYLMQFSVP